LGISVIELEFRTFVKVIQFLLRVPVQRRGLDNITGREIHSLSHSFFEASPNTIGIIRLLLGVQMSFEPTNLVSMSKIRHERAHMWYDGIDCHDDDQAEIKDEWYDKSFDSDEITNTHFFCLTLFHPSSTSPR
jgi:hypothetical protein